MSFAPPNSCVHSAPITSAHSFYHHREECFQLTKGKRKQTPLHTFLNNAHIFMFTQLKFIAPSGSDWNTWELYKNTIRVGSGPFVRSPRVLLHPGIMKESELICKYYITSKREGTSKTSAWLLQAKSPLPFCFYLVLAEWSAKPELLISLLSTEQHNGAREKVATFLHTCCRQRCICNSAPKSFH